MSGDVKRSYDSTRRQALVDATRQHVVDAARPLFVAQGYEATSMRQLAESAGVSLQTLYNAFGSKFGVFAALVDVIVAGDHEPVPSAARSEVHALDTIDDPSELITAIANVATPVLERLSIIYPTLRAAADSDQQVAEAHQRLTFEARHQDCRAMTQRLSDLGALPSDMDTDTATDIVWAVLSPDLYDLLVTQRGWTLETFTAWAITSLSATLIDPGQRRGREPEPARGGAPACPPTPVPNDR